ncbi:hypothetical protein BLNIAS_00935 [Bifidobacterium longum subsp. longum KACC 91563]|nr:hypothetical protein BLNIAS_00935 [Bifidobacterium longum subsp. longum KACC 91563]
MRKWMTPDVVAGALYVSVKGQHADELLKVMPMVREESWHFVLLDQPYRSANS